MSETLQEPTGHDTVDAVVASLASLDEAPVGEHVAVFERAMAGEIVTAEAEIPAHLLYEAGWPVCMPTHAEAMHLASVRRRVAEAVGVAADYLDGDSVSARYASLMSARDQRRPA